MRTGTDADVSEELAALCRVKVMPYSLVDGNNQSFIGSYFSQYGRIVQVGNQV
jgi:hypothetical protein